MIHPQTGAFSWTPSNRAGPRDYFFDVVATDNAAIPNSGRTNVRVTVTGSARSGRPGDLAAQFRRREQCGVPRHDRRAISRASSPSSTTVRQMPTGGTRTKFRSSPIRMGAPSSSPSRRALVFSRRRESITTGSPPSHRIRTSTSSTGKIGHSRHPVTAE